MAVSPDTRATFWYGCNMARHGEIIRLSTHILAAVGVDAAPAGGPGYCCGSPQEKHARIAAGMAERTVQKFNEKGTDQLITWCPSCHMNMDDFMAPSTDAAFETQHITQLLHARRDRLRPFLTHKVNARVMIHAHHGFNGRVPVNADVPDLLRMIPGVDVVNTDLRVPGHMCSALASIPNGLANAHRATLDAMAESGADTLVTIFHSCHREAVALEQNHAIRVVNWIHLLAQGMGLPHTDEYKAWRNAADPRDALGEDRVAALGDVAFQRLVEPELRKKPAV